MIGKVNFRTLTQDGVPLSKIGDGPLYYPNCSAELIRKDRQTLLCHWCLNNNEDSFMFNETACLSKPNGTKK